MHCHTFIMVNNKQSFLGYVHASLQGKSVKYTSIENLNAYGTMLLALKH